MVISFVSCDFSTMPLSMSRAVFNVKTGRRAATWHFHFWGRNVFGSSFNRRFAMEFLMLFSMEFAILKRACFALPNKYLYRDIYRDSFTEISNHDSF